MQEKEQMTKKHCRRCKGTQKAADAEKADEKAQAAAAELAKEKARGAEATATSAQEKS